MLRTFLIVAVSALTLTTAAADETMKFSSILHATFLESQEVGDVDDHAMSLTRYSGLTRFYDGTAGLCYLVATTDYIKGAGTFLVYNNITLSDGSVLWYKATGTTTMDGTISRFEGTVAVLGGKGKYEHVRFRQVQTFGRFLEACGGRRPCTDETIALIWDRRSSF